MKINIKGFSLLELLVSILIIGILAAVALPQYRRAVEKSRMTEAIIILREIAEMHQNYYMIHGEYLGSNGIDKLDIEIPGSINSEKRLATDTFVYSPNVCNTTCSGNEPYLAYAKRISTKNNTVNGPFLYQLYITKTNPNKINCQFPAKGVYTNLCNALNKKGILE